MPGSSFIAGAGENFIYASPTVEPKSNDEEAYHRAVQQLMRGNTMLKLRPRRTYERSYSLDEHKESIRYHRTASLMCSPFSHGCIDLGLIKEVRAGHATDGFTRLEKSSKLLEKYPESLCFSLVLSSGKSLDLIAPDKDVCHVWINVIRRLIDEKQQAQREQKLNAWLKKNFRMADTSGDGLLNFEECIQLLDKLNLKVNRDQAYELFQQAGPVSTCAHSGTPALAQDAFQAFYHLLADRTEMTELFARYASHSPNTWTVGDLKKFLSHEQGMHDKKSDVGPNLEEAAEWMIQTFEPVEQDKEAKLLTIAGFHNLMHSTRMMLFNPDHRVVYQDMTQPLQHYYIASSHNTYLTEKQLHGSTSMEGYISTVSTGCRCLELDCWDGPNGEPAITHGFTLTTKMAFKHALKAIRDHGFRSSDYPIILSLENHCSVIQQRKMAEYLKEIFGDKLFATEARQGDVYSLPSPEDLRNFVVLVAKKLPPGVVDDAEFYQDTEETISTHLTEEEKSGALDGTLENGGPLDGPGGELGEPLDHLEGSTRNLDEGYERIDMNFRESNANKRRKFRIAKALSDCVYVKEGQFKGFIRAKNDGKFYRMDNIAEPKMQTLVRDNRAEFIQHCADHLVRIYPSGLRTDSSNMNPIPAMDAGCQIVAFNYQSKTKETQIYRAIFSNNGGCGYLLKPEFMRKAKIDLEEMDNVKRRVYLTVKVISGQQLPKVLGARDKAVTDPCVVVELFGGKHDNKVERTKPVKNNGFNPIWNESFQFRIHNEDLAVLHFEVRDMDYRSPALIGQYSIPVSCIQEGYRHVELVGPQEEKMELSTLFVHVEKKIMDQFSDD